MPSSSRPGTGRLARADGDEHRVELVQQRVRRNVLPHAHAGLDDQPFFAHEVHAAVDHLFAQLEVRHAVTQVAAHFVRRLEQRHSMPGLVERVRAGHARRAAADHRDLFAGAVLGRGRADVALRERVFDHRQLVLADGHRVVVDAQHAAVFARGGAQPPGEFGEVVRVLEDIVSALPVTALDLVLPFRDQAAHRAVGVAERHAAVHAALGLIAAHVLGKLRFDLFVVQDALAHRAIAVFDALDLNKSSWIGHFSTGPPSVLLRG